MSYKSMRPKPGDEKVRIPVTFDGLLPNRGLDKSRWLWAGLVQLFWIAASCIAIFGGTGPVRILFPVCSFIIQITLVRYLVLRESYFKKQRKELLEKEYSFDDTLFWDIYAIDEGYPYVCHFSSGLKAVFIQMEKDVVVGTPDDAEYMHYECIASAYQQAARRGIECMHVDYMDTVGKDTRMDNLFAQANSCKNPDLRDVLVRMFDNVEYQMQSAYAAYDVYAFYFTCKDSVFWDELQGILSSFQEANYTRARALSRNEIGKFAEALFELEDFSVNAVCDNLFAESVRSSYLRPIWVERDGERKILAKTAEEIAEAKTIAAAEKEIAKTKPKRRKRKKKDEEPDDIDLFDE